MYRMKSIVVSILALLLLTIMCSCAKNDTPNDGDNIHVTSAPASNEQQTAVETEDVAESETIPEKTLKGEYSLESARSLGGIFLAYDDGSFDRYTTGGYCNGLTKSSTDFDGYYVLNTMLEEIPANITSDDKLVVFMDKDYNITLHHINAEVGAIRVNSDDGRTGYGHCTYMFGDNMNVSVHYTNHDSEVIDVMYIDGMNPSEYPMEITDKVVYPYKGMKSKEEHTYYYSFPKGETVTFGTAQGTALVEKEYVVSATYFDLFVNNNDWDVLDYYFADSKPTSEGYAEIKMYESWREQEIPEGKYVMVLKTDSNYMATIINWVG